MIRRIPESYFGEVFSVIVRKVFEVLWILKMYQFERPNTEKKKFTSSHIMQDP
jgi:hypothetical protein